MDKEVEQRLAEIKKIATKEDYDAINRLIENYFDAFSKKEKTKMMEFSKAAFDLEKKYIPLINQQFAKGYPCQNLILTVGFQKEPVILSILCMKPQKVLDK